MFGPESASCFPFVDPASNCCVGGGVGAACSSTYDCRGLSSCIAGTCQGDAGCDRACFVEMDGALQDCCRPEAFFGGTCVDDADCQGARHCAENGYCEGRSGCVAGSSGQRIMYDRECICANLGEFCSHSHGIPCANGCTVWNPAPDLTVCTRLDIVAGSETFALA